MEQPQLLECRAHTLIADVAVLSQGQVLLVRYKDINKYDHQAGWFLPDDELKDFEHPETAAKRILKEQLDVTVPKVWLAFIESFKGNNQTWHMAFHYRAELEKPIQVEPSQDVKSAEWFALDRLPDRSGVAHHGWALATLREITRR
jgi:ADP-ribose pyrophosphatase YjhB (NUDIX family)